MIRAVIFDLDGTLYDRDVALRRVAEEQFEAFRDELAMEKDLFIGHLFALDDHGHHRAPNFHHQLAQELGFSAQVADRLEDFFRLKYPSHCRISRDARDTLAELRARGKKLAIITNGPTLWQSRKIDSMEIAGLFDAILISEAEGIQKPDPRLFHRALERCGTSAAEALFVGDHPETDIQGAIAAGLVPVWKEKPYWRVPDSVARIGELSELLPLVFR